MKMEISIFILFLLICIIASNCLAYAPPIGIPEPSFGIDEDVSMYDLGASPNVRSESYTYYEDSPSGHPYTHFIDNSRGTDTSNDFGTYTTPRKTIPRLGAAGQLGPGAIVEVHNGMDANYQGSVRIEGVGTAASPIFIRGIDTPYVYLYISSGFTGNASYQIIEGFHCKSGSAMYRESGAYNTTYICFRNMDFEGYDSGGGTWAAITDSGYTVNNIVLYNSKIHDGGLWEHFPIGSDRDLGGINVGGGKGCSYVWILECEMYHNEYNGIQIGGTGGGTSHVYVGRCIAHHNKQSGFWTKTASNVVFSENIAYGHTSATGDSGFGFQYDPDNVWFLFNNSHSNKYGIHNGSLYSTGCDEIYMIGNVIANCDYGFQLYGNPPVTQAQIQIIGNTIYNCGYGVHNSPNTAYLNFLNNIIHATTYYIYFDTDYATDENSDIDYCIFDGDADILWNTTYTSLAAFQSGESQAANSLEQDPTFVNVDTNNFHLLTGSPAIGVADDSSTVSDIIADYLTDYGEDIGVDADGNSWTDVWDDIGAYKYMTTKSLFLKN